MPSFLIELFSEEIPARMQAGALEHLQVTLHAELKKSGFSIADNKLHGFVTPRRLAVSIDDLPTAQPDVKEELKGPKVGAPEAALAGFLKKTGLTKDQLTERDGVYFATIEQKGRPTADVLKPLIEELLAKFPWPKSMRWGSRDEVWVRPLHSILCILGSDVVPVEFAGVKASNVTHGHRFLSPDAMTIKDASEYASKLEAAHVIADRETRKARIKALLEEKAATAGLKWQEDNALLEEVVGLVEWPVVMLGKVDEQFMHLPPELLTTVMRSHQKYFTLLPPPIPPASGGGNKSSSPPHSPSLPPPQAGEVKEGAEGIEGGRQIASTFAFVANRDTATNGKEIIAGNERVLRARFSDAKFFYEQDRKKKLTEWNKGLEKVIFHAKIGTVAEKVERIKKLAMQIASAPPYTPPASGGGKAQSAEGGASLPQHVSNTASICKADLVTGMVGEFPELQGIMGSYYARAEGMSEDICEALYKLYDLPKDLKNLKPTAQILCMADRLDTLISLFAIGEKPTGSKDPYALRRAALGVIAIIRNHDIRMDLRTLLPEQAQADILEFMSDRLEADLLEQGIERTTLRAIGGLVKDGDIVRVEARARALQGFLKAPESEPMLAAYKRAANILTIEEKKDGKRYEAAGVSATFLKEPAEKALTEALAQLAKDIEPLFRQENFTAVMQRFVALKTPLDAFFDKIMVNADDAALRANRLSLLATIVSTMNKVADFREIIG